jgi:hypothetical protein
MSFATFCPRWPSHGAFTRLGEEVELGGGQADRMTAALLNVIRTQTVRRQWSRFSPEKSKRLEFTGPAWEAPGEMVQGGRV